MTTPASATPAGPRRRRKPPKRVEVVSVSTIAPRLVSVLVTGDDLDGFADAAPTSHLKVFLPADGQDEPNLPEYTPDGVVYADDGPPPTVRTYTPRELRPGRQDPGDPVPPARRGARRPRGRSGPSPATSSPSPARAAGSPLSRSRTTGGSPPTSPQSRRSAPCSRRCRRPSPPTCTSRSTAPTTRSSSPARRRPGRLAPPARPRRLRRRARRGRPRGGHPRRRRGSGWPARRPRCATSAATSPVSAASRVAQLVTRGYWRAGEQNHPDHDYGED